MERCYHPGIFAMPMLIAALALATHQGGYNPTGPRIEVELDGHKSFTITTDPKTSPKTVKAILKLVKDEFYDGQKFHRVENWVVQWGDPQSRTLPIGDSRLGSEGAGKTLPYEPSSIGFERGIVGLASNHAGIGGDGQIFIVKKNAAMLDGGYAVLGKVTSGMEVVDHIKIGAKIEHVRVIGGRKRPD